jgi:hypothetical protein
MSEVRTRFHVSTHHQIIASFVEHGHPPNDLDPAALDALAADHGVVLHPNSHRIWVAHPFSATPTATWVEDGARGWWAPCLWCALGIAALCAPAATDPHAVRRRARAARVPRRFAARRARSLSDPRARCMGQRDRVVRFGAAVRVAG